MPPTKFHSMSVNAEAVTAVQELRAEMLRRGLDALPPSIARPDGPLTTSDVVTMACACLMQAYRGREI